MPSFYPESNNGLLSNYFQFRLERIPNLIWFCQSVNLPGLVIQEFDQPTTLSHPIRSPVGAIRFDDLIMSFKVDENLENWLEIHKWIQDMSNYTNDTSFIKPWDSQRTDGQLLILNSSYNPKIKINFKKLFPIKLDSLIFDTVNPDSKEIFSSARFAFSDYSIEKLVNS